MRCLRDTHRATSVGLAPHISALQAHRIINIFYTTHIYESNHNDSLTIGSNTLRSNSTWSYDVVDVSTSHVYTTRLRKACIKHLIVQRSKPDLTYTRWSSSTIWPKTHAHVDPFARPFDHSKYHNARIPADPTWAVPHRVLRPLAYKRMLPMGIRRQGPRVYPKRQQTILFRHRRRLQVLPAAGQNPSRPSGLHTSRMG